jgi:hypothetical protein
MLLFAYNWTIVTKIFWVILALVVIFWDIIQPYCNSLGVQKFYDDLSWVFKNVSEYFAITTNVLILVIISILFFVTMFRILFWNCIVIARNFVVYLWNIVFTFIILIISLTLLNLVLLVFYIYPANIYAFFVFLVITLVPVYLVIESHYNTVEEGKKHENDPYSRRYTINERKKYDESLRIRIYICFFIIYCLVFTWAYHKQEEEEEKK